MNAVVLTCCLELFAALSCGYNTTASLQRPAGQRKYLCDTPTHSIPLKRNKEACCCISVLIEQIRTQETAEDLELKIS